MASKEIKQKIHSRSREDKKEATETYKK